VEFRLNDEQQAFSDLARQILEEGATHERMREIEAQDGPRFDPELWTSVAQSGLLGICIPESYGGGEQGFFELGLVVEQIGRTAAPIPLLESIVLGALPLMQFGSEDQKKSLLPDTAEGKQILTAALVEDLADPLEPLTRASTKGDGWQISGRKICVPAGQIATRVLVPATLDDDRVGVFVVDPTAAGVTVEPLETTGDQPEASITLEGVSVGAGDLLGAAGDGVKIIEWIRERANAAQCCLALGVCEEALRLTAEYTTSRKQFGEPIATFQAVGQRQADAYVDTEAIRLTAWQACWRLGAGMDASDAVAVAKYWAAMGGQRVVHTAVHQHGGMGVDRDYPLHRHFLYAKQLELSLGGTTQQLLKIGKMLADTPVASA
jgi:alkylation response protein AidB-like acyl-CoA dehydrogenase